MQDYISIGAGPAYEQIEQANVSGSNYARMRAECAAFIGQLRRQLGQEPEGAHLNTKFWPDGIYGYYEVVCFYDSKIRAAIDYAFRCEREMPEKWDAEAKRELLGVEVGVQG
jgi:hypothetical protein